MPPAARITATDLMTCPASDPVTITTTHTCSKDTTSEGPPKPHVGGPLTAQGSPTVKVNNLPAARTGDIGTCTNVGKPNLIVTGDSTVKINGQLGARVGSVMAHHTSSAISAPCSPDVIYGGPPGGASFGDSAASAAATKACQDAAINGRGGAGKEQDKNMNCGMESARQLCLQKCQAEHLPPDSPACKCGNMNQDDWYKRYLDTYKKQHNEIASKNDYAAKKKEYDAIKKSNDEKWAKVREHKLIGLGAQASDRWPPPADWPPFQGRNVYCFHDTSKNHTSDDDYHIDYLPELPIPTIGDDTTTQAKEGDVGSYTDTRTLMLKDCGYTPTTGDNSASGIGNDLANGNLVLPVVDVGKLPGGGNSGAHTITVTRMEYDASGNLMTVVINDTSRPNCCGQSLTGSQFDKALMPNGAPTNVVPAPQPGA